MGDAAMSLKITAAQMVAEARARIEEVETLDLIARLDDPDVVIVDIRDIRERKHGFIPGSIHAPRGMIEFWVDPESPYYKDVFGQEGKRYVFHCASGWRSALTVATLQDMGFEAAHLREGFSTWEARGGPVAMPEPKT
jgi:rhodanese-related sulfurtransferase